MKGKLYHFENPLLIFQELIKVAQSNPGDLLQHIELIMPLVGEYDRGALLALTSSMEDNDFKAMGIHKKAVRLMNDSINEIHVHKLADLPDYFDVATNKARTGYIIREISTDNIYEYFPKSNRLHSRKSNKWVDHGHKTLIKFYNKYVSNKSS